MHMYELLTPLRRRGAEPVPAGTAIPLSWDDGEALVRLGAAVRVEAETIAVDATDASRDARRRELLRQLADVAGVDEGLMVVVAPSSAGMYLMTVGDAGVSDIQPYDRAADPLASDDPAVIRRHHLDALRALDDLNYLVFDDDAAADLGGLVMLSLDGDTGIITGVTGRSAAPIGVEVVDAPLAGAGAAEQLPGAIDGDGAPVPPVAPPPGGQAAGDVVIEPADDDELAAMTKAQLLAETSRLDIDFDGNPTKAELIALIVAKRVAA